MIYRWWSSRSGALGRDQKKLKQFEFLIREFGQIFEFFAILRARISSQSLKLRFRGKHTVPCAECDLMEVQIALCKLGLLIW